MPPWRHVHDEWFLRIDADNGLFLEWLLVVVAVFLLERADVRALVAVKLKRILLALDIVYRKDLALVMQLRV